MSNINEVIMIGGFIAFASYGLYALSRQLVIPEEEGAPAVYLLPELNECFMNLRHYEIKNPKLFSLLRTDINNFSAVYIQALQTSSFKDYNQVRRYRDVIKRHLNLLRRSLPVGSWIDFDVYKDNLNNCLEGHVENLALDIKLNDH